MAKLASYLTSRRHLGGLVLALLGAGLALADPVGPQGAWLIVGFYLLGAMATHEPAQSRFGFEPRRVHRRLSEKLAGVSGRVPPEVMVRLRRIELTIQSEILPRLEVLPPGSHELYLVERTASAYLPAALDAYLCLPPNYVSPLPGTEGRSALSVLVEELDVLDAGMRSVAASVHRADMTRLLVHKHFLNERFPHEQTGVLLADRRPE
ncbi:MAG: hypothetical protein ABI401_14620 [Candidatus Dormibacter sp.]